MTVNEALHILNTGKGRDLDELEDAAHTIVDQIPDDRLKDLDREFFLLQLEDLPSTESQ